MRARLFSRLIATSALCALLTACGGGGGGSSFLGGGSGNMGNNTGGSSEGTAQIVLNTSLTQSDPANFETSEYNRTSGFGGSTGLAQINAAEAYGMGATGTGIKVALIDTGIDVDNVEFTGAISADSINIVTGGQDLEGPNPHGTWTAGVIGARKNGTYTHGVAFNSELLVIRTDTVTEGCPSGCFSTTNMINALNYATAHDARIINMSLGTQGTLGGSFNNAIANAAAHDILIVAAAGNAGLNSVDTPANLGGSINSLLAVGSVDENNVISSWSNRAGSSKNWYLVAPGQNILTTDEEGMALVAGTSFAAPMVSGAAALVMEYAPYLTAAQVAQILLTTATDLGAAGVDDVYGHGLLNVGAALQPVGETTVPSGGDVGGGEDGGGASTSATTLSLGAAFGNALSGNDLLGRGIMLDSFGRAFGFDMSDRVQSAAYQSNLAGFLDTGRETTTRGVNMGVASLVSSFTTDAKDAHAIRDLKDQDGPQGDTRLALSASFSENSSVTYTHGFGIGQAFGLQADESRVASDLTEQAAFGNAYLNMVEGGNAMIGNLQLAEGLTLDVATGAETGAQSFTSDTHTSGDRSATAASLNYEAGSVKVGLNAGIVNEGNSTLGSDSNGALAFGSGSTTQFAGVTARINLKKGLTLAASYTIGQTSIEDAANSLIGSFKDVRSDSFAVALTADDVVRKNDRLTFAVSQPVRVMSGSANLTVPTGVDGAGAVQYTSQRVGLTPTGRQIDIQLGYALALSDKETLGVSSVGTLNPGHDANAATAYSVGVRYTKKF
ncbi:MAG: S8 family peptidase [Bdellovibrionales bacterium]